MIEVRVSFHFIMDQFKKNKPESYDGDQFQEDYLSYSKNFEANNKVAASWLDYSSNRLVFGFENRRDAAKFVLSYDLD